MVFVKAFCSSGSKLVTRLYSPHEIIDAPVAVDPHWKVNRYERVFEISVHDEIRVRQPNIIVVVDGVQVVVLALIRISQPGIVPLLLQKEFYFVFLQLKKK